MPPERLKGKAGRYQRIVDQLEELLAKPGDDLSRMATIVAVLHHKLPDYFWTGFYLIKDGDLIVGPYQGPVACQLLERHQGVCWAAIDRGETVVVPDVHAFPGHIACDARSNSEIVVLLRKPSIAGGEALKEEAGSEVLGEAVGQIVGVLDIDSEKLGTFDEVDAEWLERIVAMVYP